MEPHVFPDRLQKKAIPIAETTRLFLTRHAKTRYPPDTGMIHSRGCTSSPAGGAMITHTDINSKQEKRKRTFGLRSYLDN